MLENLLKRARPSVMKERSGPVIRPSIDCRYIEGQCDEFKAAVAGHKAPHSKPRKHCEREFYLPHLLLLNDQLAGQKAPKHAAHRDKRRRHIFDLLLIERLVGEKRSDGHDALHSVAVQAGAQIGLSATNAGVDRSR